MEAVSVCFRGILLIKNRISTGFPLPIRSTGFSLSLSEICFYALIKLNYFSLSVHSLLELGKTKQKKGLGITVFFPFINSFTTNPLWVVKTRLQIMNNILLYFDFLLRISFSSPHYHRYTPQQPDPPFSGEFNGDRS